MLTYTSVSIIYNPNSTGQSKKLAVELKKQLLGRLKGIDVKLMSTERAGHAEELAYEAARSSARPLVISSSGDGGYHEVINGLIKAQKEGARPIAGLLPAGNANDHYTFLHEIDTADAIVSGKVKVLDIFRLESTVAGMPFTRYAHSYIGIGLTPKAGHELNKRSLNPVKEIWLVIKVLFLLKPVRIIVRHKVRSYYSLIFSNIAKMSKVVTVAKGAEINDNKFEITPFHDKGKLRLLWKLLVVSAKGLPGDRQVSEYSFSTIRMLLVQLDGEIFKLDAQSDVKIVLEPKLLSFII